MKMSSSRTLLVFSARLRLSGEYMPTGKGIPLYRKYSPCSFRLEERNGTHKEKQGGGRKLQGPSTRTLARSVLSLSLACPPEEWICLSLVTAVP